MKSLGLLLGAAAVAAVAFVVFDKKAGAATATTGTSTPWPAGWVPPAGAQTVVLPTNPTGLALGKTTWSVAADAGGTAPGTYALYQNTKSAQNDWAVFFNGTLMQKGTSQNSGLIAQAVGAGLVS